MARLIEKGGPGMLLFHACSVGLSDPANTIPPRYARTHLDPAVCTETCKFSIFHCQGCLTFHKPSAHGNQKEPMRSREGRIVFLQAQRRDDFEPTGNRLGGMNDEASA